MSIGGRRRCRWRSLRVTVLATDDRRPPMTDRSRPMMPPDRTYDPIRFSRGTRAFAAFVTTFNGLVVLALAIFIAPTLGLDRLVTTWTVLAGVVAGVAHIVAAVGLVRGRRWAAELVGYLGAAGIALAAGTALAAVIGPDVFGGTNAMATGFSLWMIAWWYVAIRFAMRPFTFDRPWSSVGLPALRVAAPRATTAPPSTAAPRPGLVATHPMSTAAV
jgi:hypothetical protein